MSLITPVLYWLGLDHLVNPHINFCCDPYGILYLFIPILFPYLGLVPLMTSTTDTQRTLSTILIFITAFLAVSFMEYVTYWSWINHHTLPDGTMRRGWWEHYLGGAIMYISGLVPLAFFMYMVWEHKFPAWAQLLGDGKTDEKPVDRKIGEKAWDRKVGEKKRAVSFN